ncbi:conserved membrane hypothetical protein [Hyphomicrobiales bacterium]|nr:conserved membrane hypothetical protein [Hyphomicrobiales bacterium]CAH1702744.1 membrane hypothetical protein [Hyphomicrobiales bacterium]CAI0346934.1 conserved membrane hypothetical protein [Hyphomicrobiales bacterium]
MRARLLGFAVWGERFLEIAVAVMVVPPLVGGLMGFALLHAAGVDNGEAVSLLMDVARRAPALVPICMTLPALAAIFLRNQLLSVVLAAMFIGAAAGTGATLSVPTALPQDHMIAGSIGAFIAALSCLSAAIYARRARRRVDEMSARLKAAQ